MTITVGDVRSFILEHFSDAELQSLCFVYFQGSEQAFADGMPLETKVRKLIEWCQNRGQVTQLFTALKTERGEVFVKCFSEPLPTTLDDAFPDATPAVVSVNALQVSEVLADRIIAEKTSSMRIFTIYLAGLIAVGLFVIGGSWLFLAGAARQIAAMGGIFICSLGAWQVRGIIDRQSQKSRCMAVKTVLAMIRQGQGSVDANTWKQIQDYLWGQMSAPTVGEKVTA